MSILHLSPTLSTPEVILDPSGGRFVLRGESYPENVLSFYAPILERLRDVLEDPALAALDVEMHITYYNSASAKAFQRIFQVLEKTAEAGRLVRLLWQYDEEDDMARELGWNFREDFPAIAFEDMPLAMV